MYKYIIGWDFGDGENSADVMECAGGATQPLSLDEHELLQPTIIFYDPENGAIAGSTAGVKPGAITGFKVSPRDWDKVIGGVGTCRAIMHDYFSQIMHNIRKYNAQYFLDGDDAILLLVGCPSSALWMSEDATEQYRALITEATGLPHVRIVPESRAALFSAFARTSSVSINVSDGAAVFDFGSSTADFTYMKLGECIADRSWRLGAATIERMMLREILLGNALSMNDIWDGGMGTILYSLRLSKENYYTNGYNMNANAIRPFVADANGDLIPEGKRKDGSTSYKAYRLNYDVDDDFMESVIHEQGFAVPENPCGKDQSWYQHCKAFFMSMRALLQDNELPCRTIVLTGGASKMYFVQELCQEVFGITPIIASIPSRSVSVGLCTAGRVDEAVKRIADSKKAALHKASDDAYARHTDDCASSLAKKIYYITLRVMQESLEQPGAMTVGALRSAMMSTLTRELTQTELEEALAGALRDWSASCGAAVTELANEAAAELYPTQTMSVRFQLAPEASVSDSFSLPMDADALYRALDIENMAVTIVVSSILLAIGTVVMTTGIGFFPGLALAVGGLVFSGPLTKWLNNHGNTKVTHSQRQETLRQLMSNGGGSVISQYKEKIKETIDDAVLPQLGEYKRKHYAQLDTRMDEALGMVTLRNFNRRL